MAQDGKVLYAPHARTTAQSLRYAGISTYLPPGALVLAQTTFDRASWYRKAREMRHDATIAFLRDLYIAPLLASEWSVECDDDKYKDAVPSIEASFVKRKQKFLRDVMRGLMDYGWQSFETVKKIMPDGTTRITKLKPLLPDITEIVVDEHGELLGVINSPFYVYYYREPVRCYRGQCLVLYRDAEGTNWYGDPLMKRVEVPFDSWKESEAAARRFDNKLAGSHWVVYYPVGSTPFNGTETDNGVIAQGIMRTLHSSGMVSIPQSVMRHVEDLSQVDQAKMGWRVELISPQTQQAAFVDRAKYLDSIKCRAFGIPERAVIEGSYGTKAEAEAHADFAIDAQEMTHKDVIELVNDQGVDPMLEENHGPEYVGKVRLVASPLDDDKKQFLKTLYTTHWGTEAGQAEENDRVDWEKITEMLDVPTRVTGNYPIRQTAVGVDEPVARGVRRLVGPGVSAPAAGVGERGGDDAGHGAGGSAGLGRGGQLSVNGHSPGSGRVSIPRQRGDAGVQVPPKPRALSRKARHAARGGDGGGAEARG